MVVRIAYRPKLKAQGYENASFGTLVMAETDVRAGVEWIFRTYV